MKESTMATIKDIAAKLNEGCSYSEVSKALGISKSTVSKYANRIKQSNLTLAQASECQEQELEETVRVPIKREYRDFNAEEILGKLTNVKYETRQLLYEHYKSEDPETACSYATFCRRLEKLIKEKTPTQIYTNLERIPGESLEVDFAGDSVTWIDRRGKKRTSRLFLATLTFSQKIYICAFENEKQISWMGGIVKALEFFGGAPKTLIVDNAKSLVVTHGKDKIDYSPILQSLCNYYGISSFACRPGTPKGKNRVENSVTHTYRRVLASLRLNGPIRAGNLEDLNQQIAEHRDIFNKRPFTKNLQSNRELEFNTHERQKLKNLPILPYEIGNWRYLKVDKGHCIRLGEDGGHRYSVPVIYVGMTVTVLKMEERVLIYDKETGSCIAQHKRYLEITGEKTHILPEHLTPKEKRQRLTKEQWVEELVKCGYDRETVSNVLTAKWKVDTLNARRFCFCLKLLLRECPIAIAREALQTAYERRYLNYEYIKEWAKMRQKETLLGLTENATDLNYRTISHENIRNNYC